MEHGFWFACIITPGPGISLFKDLDMSKIDAKDCPDFKKDLVKCVYECLQKVNETA